MLFEWTDGPRLLPFGSSKGDVPHILDTGQHETLPLGIDVVRKLTEVLKSDEDVTVSVIQKHDAEALMMGNCRVRSSTMMSATRTPWTHYRLSVSSWTSPQAATTVRLLKHGSMFRWDLSRTYNKRSRFRASQSASYLRHIQHR